MTIKPIPDGYHSVTPYLAVKGAARALEFYDKAFGAKELFRLTEPSGKVGHAELRIGDSRIMITDEYPEMGAIGPESLGGSSVGLCVYVEDVDASFERAVSAGARAFRPVKNQFYGDRTGMVIDPFGHKWTLATHIEDVAPEEVKKRMGNAAMEEFAKTETKR